MSLLHVIYNQHVDCLFKYQWVKKKKAISNNVVVQSLSPKSDSVIPWTAAHQAPLSTSVFWSLLRFMSVESVMLYNYLMLCHPFSLLSSIFPIIRVFSNESVLRIRWPKYWSFSFSNYSSNIQGWFPLGLTGWITLQSKGLSRVFSSITVSNNTHILKI